jgi:hypothetical protein
MIHFLVYLPATAIMIRPFCECKPDVKYSTEHFIQEFPLNFVILSVLAGGRGGRRPFCWGLNDRTIGGKLGRTVDKKRLILIQDVNTGHTNFTHFNQKICKKNGRGVERFCDSML